MKISKIFPFIGLFILLYLLASIDLQKVGSLIANMNLFYFLLAVALTGIIFVLKAVKWKVIIHAYGISFSLWEALKGWLVGFSISLITPAKAGDFVRSYYLKDKTKIGKSITTVMADRVSDLFIVFILAVIGLYFFATYTSSTELLVTTFIFFVLFVVGLVLFSKKSLASFFLRPFYKRFSSGFQNKIKGVYDDFYAGLEILIKKKGIMIFTLLFTTFLWILSVLQFYLIALALGLDLSFEFLLLIVPLITLVIVLPVSISGIGTRDATTIFFLSFAGISAEAALSFSLMLLFTDYIFSLFGFFLWYKNPIKISLKTQKNTEDEYKSSSQI